MEKEINKQYVISQKLKILSIVLVAIGIISVIMGFMNNPQRTWGNFLVCNYYFISLVIGATFFMAIQRITQSGWSAMFKRIPEAFAGYLPVAAILMLFLVFFGTHSLYHWSHEDAVSGDIILQKKAPYLNIPFYIVRALLFLGAWIFLTILLRNFSVREDNEGGLAYFTKSEFYSRVYIFTLALTFTLATFDWIMSIDSHWFSTIFAVKNFVSAFLHGSAAVVLTVILLHRSGYFPQLNQYHLHDFSKYLFMLSIMWGYTWFSQFFLIWFGNIPEETVYYTTRTSAEWNKIFLADISINWLFPFLFLMLNKIAKNTRALVFASVILLIGFWLDIYLQVMPGVTGINTIGFTEIGVFVGFLGIFILSVARTLSRANLIPVNHPYLQESLVHELH